MEQRARVMGKNAEAAVYRKYINQMKEKTKQMKKKESLLDKLEKEMKVDEANIMKSLRRVCSTHNEDDI